MKLSEEDLCALLRFRYAKVDPLMARVETCHVGAMYAFCKGLRDGMYEETARGLIKWQMARECMYVCMYYVWLDSRLYSYCGEEGI